MDKIAVKLLSMTDLSLFEAQYRARNVARQKSVNINKSVFSAQFFPNAMALIGAPDREARLTLDIRGPRASDRLVVTRKIKIQEKNWRLNGEVVPSPADDPDRYRDLAPNDIAVMRFEGDALPERLTLYLVAAAVPEDAAVLAALRTLVAPGPESMAAVSRRELSRLLSGAGLPAASPLSELLVDEEYEEALEEAAQGGSRKLWTLRRTRGRRPTQADLKSARETMERVGREGEELVNVHLGAEAEAGRLTFTWVSDGEPTAPLDFEIVRPDGGRAKVDVKSTRSGHGKAFHMSAAEVLEAAGSMEEYLVYRVSELGDEGGVLRISADMRELARSIAASPLPNGVSPDSFAIDPGLLYWGPSVALRWPAEGD